MVVIEIPPNSNCEPVDLRVFHDVEVARAVRQVHLEQAPGHPTWYDVTGWTLNGTSSPALARRVDDSGEGSAVLVTGGDAGLRLRPAGSTEAWSMTDPRQWGAPFLLLANEPNTIVYKEVSNCSVETQVLRNA